MPTIPTFALKYQDMIRSMTGFGKAVLELPGKKITVEVRSLNSKQLDLNLRVPSLYREKEAELRSEISKTVERGKVDLGIYSESTGEASAVSVNLPLAKNYYQELKTLAKELNEKNDHLLPIVVKMPDVFRNERQELDEKEWKEVAGTVSAALAAFNVFRADEGKTLKRELLGRIDAITGLLEEVKKLDEKRIPAVRERLQKSVDELKEKVDQNRFEQELIYYIEKFDITEEKVRLLTHCEYFRKTIEEASSGRKLGFISQEIGREINTIGSKANDAGIQKLVVQMKDDLEKVKEQLLNVL
jgi:uncharacterized protein (TIGR00255 family)